MEIKKTKKLNSFSYIEKTKHLSWLQIKILQKSEAGESDGGRKLSEEIQLWNPAHSFGLRGALVQQTLLTDAELVLWPGYSIFVHLACNRAMTGQPNCSVTLMTLTSAPGNVAGSDNSCT